MRGPGPDRKLRKLQELPKPGASDRDAAVVSFVLRTAPGAPSVAFERGSADFSNQLTIQPKPSHSRPSSGSAKALVLFLRCWVT